MALAERVYTKLLTQPVFFERSNCVSPAAFLASRILSPILMESSFLCAVIYRCRKLIDRAIRVLAQKLIGQEQFDGKGIRLQLEFVARKKCVSCEFWHIAKFYDILSLSDVLHRTGGDSFEKHKACSYAYVYFS